MQFDCTVDTNNTHNCVSSTNHKDKKVSGASDEANEI